VDVGKWQSAADTAQSLSALAQSPAEFLQSISGTLQSMAQRERHELRRV
jgi:hypothetical protein